MNGSDARNLYAYTDWANERMLAAMRTLSGEQFERTIVSSFSSIRDTLAHIAFAEWLWLERWKGSSPSQEPPWTRNAALGVLDAQMHRTADDRRAFLGALSDDAVVAELRYTNMKGDPFALLLGDLLLHCANHSTYHRGQLVTMLRQAGATPPNTDYTQFLRA